MVPTGLLLVVGLALIAFRLPLADSLRLLYEGAFADKFGIHRTIIKSVPLILTGLGIVISWRAGVFNIGGEGQLLVGVCAGAVAASWTGSLVVILLACIVGGAFYASIAGWLYVKRGVNVVISTILLNFVAIQLVNYLVRGPLQESTHSIPQTTALPTSAMFRILDPQTTLHAGIFLAPIAALCIWLWLQKTPSGFRLRLTGANSMAARAARIPVPRVQFWALVLSGAVCGLAGGVQYVGVSGYLNDQFSPGWGLLGIPVALLGGLHPLGVMASGLYFGALLAGSKNLEAFGAASSSLVFAMQGITVLAFVGLQEYSKRKVAAGVA